jgi:hypothetical protein
MNTMKNYLQSAIAWTGALLTGASAAVAPSAEEALTITLPGLAPRVDSAFNRQGLVFEPNMGQTDAEVQFLARGPGYQLFLTATEAVMVLNPGSDSPDTPPGFGVRQPSAALWDEPSLREDHEFTELTNAFQPLPRSRSHGFVRDGFVTKFAAEGKSVIYSTYFGGSDHDGVGAVAGMALGPDGTFWIAGSCHSRGLATAGAFH